MSDKPSLLSLPVEIRLQIYSHLDHDDSPIDYPLSEPHGSQASFILTCRQLRYEMQHDFFSKNIFAIRFNCDMGMSSTKNPFFKAVHAMAGKFRRIDDFQLPIFHVQRIGRLFDIPTLEHDERQEPTDLRPFARGSALGDGLEMIENLELHVLHWRLDEIHHMAFDNIREYVGNCKEQLNVVLEALVVFKNMKGTLGLKKLTVVDNVPCNIWERGYGTSIFMTEACLKAMLADAYWPLLTQAAATLGISIENIKVIFDTFPESDCRMKGFELPATRCGASTKAATREDTEAKT